MSPMNSWVENLVSMMAEENGARIKQEVDTNSCCSPSPSTGNNAHGVNFRTSPNSTIEYKVTLLDHANSSPESPDGQFCSSTTSALGEVSSDSIQQSTIKEELPRRICLVCGDTASGFHYGVASCEACKAFFKRTIQGNIEYTCPANNVCEINKRRRKACQACRFQKCLRMGMLKEGVRLDRVRGGRQKYRRNPLNSPYQLQLPHSNAISTGGATLEDNKILEMLSSFEPDPLCVGHGGIDLMNRQMDVKVFMDDRMGVDAQEMLSVLSDLYDRELVNVISWAKQIPGFTDLPLNDQMKLLQGSWAEILILQLAHRSVPFNGKLYFATDFWLDERSAKECGAVELYSHCALTIQRVERIAASKEEYYLLKALLLANCDVKLDNYGALRKFRETILAALNDCVYVLRHSTAVSHQQQLLLLLPALRQADPIIRKFWSRIYREGNVTMNKLFLEMLEPVSR
ncbi:steroid hormone receptor ERR2 isoform X2 [Lutzomyia longipalpis]|uniref:steroid hormone receptor ERR2 isoform X2 n=1 Tax=Lutzomyia longipalpis TaxID=7200 RepID=UPI002483DDA0|nr:steroid hormone receptor ERR2 isoform X2 [Lutzomyia longipalpis]